MTDGEIIYAASDVYKKLRVKDSTLRKYVEVLTRKGYNIEKDTQGRRKYTEHDVIILEKFIELSKHNGMTLEKAAKLIMQQLNINNSDNKQVEEMNKLMPFDLQQQYSVMLDQINNEQKKHLHEMENRISKQIDQNMLSISERLEKIAVQEEERIKKRDDVLMQTFRSQQENKQLLLQIGEEIAASKEVTKKWWRFW